MHFEENKVEILGDQISINLTKNINKSKKFFAASFILFVLGLFSIIISSATDKHAKFTLNLIIIIIIAKSSFFKVIQYTLLTLLFYFIYNEFFWRLLKKRFVVFPYDAYKLLSYAIGFLVTYAYPIYQNALISGISLIFTSFVVLTDGFSYRIYKVNVILGKNKVYTKYFYKIAKSIFLPYIDTFTLSNDNENYYYFIRLKSRSIIDRDFVKHYEESGNVYWNLDKEPLIHEPKITGYRKVRFECYVYFENASKDGIDVNHLYVPIGVFTEKTELINFLNLLSENIQLVYKSPPEISRKIKM